MRPCKIGVYLPTYEREMDGVTPSWGEILAMARRAEEIGLDSVWIADHLLIRRDDETTGPWAAFPLLAALAASTTSIEIGPLVACALWWNPALLAKTADTIDEISGGRLILGLGAGSRPAEFSLFGYPDDRRVARFEEALQIIAPLLREGRVDFQGRFYDARDCELRPRGPRPNGPPLMVAGSGERMLRLAAQYADSWNTIYTLTGNSIERFAELNARVDAACEAVGRDPATLERTVSVYIQTAPYIPVTDWGTPPLSGTPEELAAALRAYANLGVSHIQIGLEPQTLAGIDGLIPVLETLYRS